ncbi:MAG: hypothetical protein ACPG80_01925 [Rickettsiales bacterium]
MVKDFINQVQTESKEIGKAAGNVFKKTDATTPKKLSVGFKQGTTTTKVTVLGGVLSGVTLSLQGIRNIRKGLMKDKESGKRDYATIGVGMAEAAGGVFVTSLFYERLKLSNDGCDVPER